MILHSESQLSNKNRTRNLDGKKNLNFTFNFLPPPPGGQDPPQEEIRILPSNSMAALRAARGLGASRLAKNFKKK